jgi:23S rRNA (uracil1939-C5)-methyltransferase
VAAFPGLRAIAAPLFEHPKSAPTLHTTLTETGIDVDVTGVEAKSGGLSADRRRRVAEAAAEAGFARVTLSGEMVFQARAPIVRFGEARVALPAGGFLQAVPEAEDAMAAFAMQATAGAGLVADLFCGAGTFSFRLAEQHRVLAMDAAEDAVAALKAALGTAPGLKPIEPACRDLFRRPLLAMEMKKVEAAVFDPPRAGAAEQAGELARSKLARVVGVSCNPATFARDAAMLIAGGFRLERVLPVDQFLWSPHIELVGVFTR